MHREFTRRTVLGTVGVALAGSIAGCSGGQNDSDGPTDDTGGETPTGEESVTPSVDEFLSNTNNFDGITDATGTSTVTVDVGTEGNGAYYAFTPPAIRVDPGTTVRWVWTGKGGVHDVVATSGADFESPDHTDAGATFEREFEDPGTVLYVCTLHEGTGMKGAVVVSE